MEVAMARDWSRYQASGDLSTHLAGYLQALADVSLIIASKGYGAEDQHPEYMMGHAAALDSVQYEIGEAVRTATAMVQKLAGD
jgi:hypothetical protein